MRFKKIITITFLLLAILAIGAVSAAEQNATDDLVSVEQTDEISTCCNNSEILSADNNDDEVIAINDNNSEMLSAGNNDDEVIAISENNDNDDEVLSISENNSKILGVKNNNVISDSNNDVLSNSSSGNDPEVIYKNTEYKTFTVGTVKFLKKYKKMALKGYKIPSKKNKKAWKNHKSYLKAYKKQMKKFKKSAKKIFTKLVAAHWHDYGDIIQSVKYKGKYMYLIYKVKCYRTYNYNSKSNEGWWD